MNYSHLAVILGGDVNGLGHVRSLGAAGIPTTVICSDRFNPASYSKYCSAEIIPTAGGNYDGRLLQSLRRIAKASSSAPVLFPSNDYFVDFMSRHLDELKGWFRLNVSHETILKKLSDKRQSHTLAHECGIHSPMTYSLAAIPADDEVAGSLSYPCIIKPLDSYSHVFPWKNWTVRSQLELNAFIRAYSALVPHSIIQPIIPGGDSNIYQCTTYRARHLPAQLFTVQKLHQQPVGYGTMTFGRSVEMSNLKEQTCKILDHIDYNGFASAEFKRSDADGRYYLIEINPRLPWYNALFTSSGVNFPVLAYADLTDQLFDTPLPLRQTDNVYWLHLRNEARGLRERWRSGQSDGMIRDILRLWRARSHAHFAWSDLRPFLMAYLDYFRYEIAKFKPAANRHRSFAPCK